MTKKIAHQAIVAAVRDAVIVRTTDGQQIIISPTLAREIGGQLIGMSYLSEPPDGTILADNWPVKGKKNG